MGSGESMLFRSRGLGAGKGGYKIREKQEHSQDCPGDSCRQQHTVSLWNRALGHEALHACLATQQVAQPFKHCRPGPVTTTHSPSLPHKPFPFS